MNLKQERLLQNFEDALGYPKYGGALINCANRCLDAGLTVLQILEWLPTHHRDSARRILVTKAIYELQKSADGNSDDY